MSLSEQSSDTQNIKGFNETNRFNGLIGLNDLIKPKDTIGLIVPLSIERGLNQCLNLNSKPLTQHFDESRRKEILQTYRKKQPFRVAIGKSQWVNYETFNPSYNLREILNDEVVIEFDTDNLNKAWEGVNFTGINLYNANITFEVWEHGGRSPHIHIHDLPIANLEPNKRALFKKLFIRKYVPLEYLDCVDTSLCGVHLVRLEFSPCWKGKYGTKKLLFKFEPLNDKKEVQQ